MVLLHQKCPSNLNSIHLISKSSLVNVTKLRGHAPLSILRTNPAKKISFPVGYVIGLTHHSPFSILRMKPRKCFIYSADETILPSLSRFHMNFPVSYVIRLRHHSPSSILWMKPRKLRKCFVYSVDATILPNHNDFHMVTGDSPFHHAGGMRPIFKFIF